MSTGESSAVPPETVAHRIGGGALANLHLKPREQTLTPPGFSVLLGGTPAQAGEQMRQAFPDPKKYARIHKASETVGSATIDSITKAGFVVIADPSAKFPNHARITHPDGVAGFSDANLDRLSKVFQDTPTPRS